jgi:hypothetical protein
LETESYIVLSIIALSVSSVVLAARTAVKAAPIIDTRYVAGDQFKSKSGDSWCLCHYSQENNVTPAPQWHSGVCGVIACGHGHVFGTQGTPPPSGR